MSLQSEVIRILNNWLATAKKITQLTALPSPVTTGDLFEVVRGGVNYKADGSQLPAGVGATTEHVTKNANFIVSTADTRKTYVIDSASPVTAQLPDLTAAVVDYEWALIYINTGGGSIDVNGQPAVSSNGVDFDFIGPDVQMYLYYDSEAGEYRFQNGTAGVSGDLQDVLDAGSSATITGDVEIIRTGEYSFELKAATGVTLGTTNEPIAINAGAVAGGSRFDLYVDALIRLQLSNHNDYYTSGGTSHHRFFAPGAGAQIRLMEESGSGSNYIALKAPTDVTTAQVYTFPAAGPSVDGSALVSATSGALTFVPIIGTQDLFVSAAAMWPRTTNPCADLAKTEIATSLFNIQSLDFDQTTQEFAQFQIVLPRKWNNGTVTAVFYWTAAAGSGDVQWGISGGAYSNDDALTVAFGTAQTADDTLLATNDLHISPATSAITLAGTPADADFLAFQISRNPASDTLNADAKLLGVSIRITTDAAVDA